MSVFLCNPHVVDIFNSLLTSQTQSDVPTQQLSYETTFNRGDFYVSVLLSRETEFVSKPVIPLAYVIHERKRYATHDNFFRYLKWCVQISIRRRMLSWSLTTNYPSQRRSSLTFRVLRRFSAGTIHFRIASVGCESMACPLQLRWRIMSIQSNLCYSQPHSENILTSFSALQRHGANHLRSSLLTI